MKKEKYLILGCNGMLGSILSLYLKKQGYKPIGFARSNSKIIKTIIGNALDFDLLEKIIIENRFDCIVNCVGILNKNAEDNPEYAKKINTDLPLFLQKITKNSKTKIIHISTDCVFDGKKGGYKEIDTPNETSIYGKTKAGGEIKDNKNLTIRTSFIGPDIKKNGIGLFNWFMNQKDTICGYKNVIWSGITSLELSKIILCLSKDKKAVGLVHMVNNAMISKFDLLNLLKKYTNRKIEIIENTSIKQNKSLIRTNYDFNYHIPSYETMIKQMVDWINQNKFFYKNYK